MNKNKLIDEIEEISNFVSKEISVPKTILDSFAIKDSLNPKLWENDILKPEVRTKLIEISEDFFASLELSEQIILKDILFVGSLANFNWSKYSDIDLHLVIDFSELQGESDFIKTSFDAQKNIWNKQHDITINNFPIEIYIQDIKEKLHSSSIYSIKNNKWIIKPEHENFKIDKKTLKEKADNFISTLKTIKQIYKRKNYRKVIDQATSLKDKIKKYRKAGLDKGGEFSIENMVFKILRRTSFMEILDSYKTKAYDNLMTMEGNLVQEGELLDNTKFKLFRGSDDELEFQVTYDGEIIGKLYLDMIYNVEEYFEGDFSEQEIEKLFIDEPLLIIEWLEVPNDYNKGGGVGRELMNKAIEYAKKNDFNQIYLNASPIGNQGLNIADLTSWYESFGFETILNQGHNKLMLLNLKKNMLEIKEIIKKYLNLVIETNFKYTSEIDYDKMKFRIAKVRELYGNDEYFENAEQGQWVGSVIVDARGNIRVLTNKHQAGDVRKNNLNTRGENANYINFTIMAGRGVDHPNTLSSTTTKAVTRHGLNSEKDAEGTYKYRIALPPQVAKRTGQTHISIDLPKPGSPASDASIKTYLIYGDVILDFMKKNMKDYNPYTADGKGAEISNNDMSDANKYKKMKKDEKNALWAKNKAEKTIQPPSPGQQEKIDTAIERMKKSAENIAKAKERLGKK